MKLKFKERGQSLVIIALAVIGLFGFTGLAIDGSRVFSARRNAQNAADTAALAAALARIRQPEVALKDAVAVDAAVKRAKSNGYEDGAKSTVVEVHMCSEMGLKPPCEGIPGGATKSEYIQVKIERVLPATFGKIVGRDTFDILVTAIAHAEDSTPEPLFDGAALVTLKREGDKTFYGNGNSHLTVINSGVFNNSKDLCGMKVNGTGVFKVDKGFQLAGDYNDKDCSSPVFGMVGDFFETTQVKYPPDIMIPIPDIVCSGNPDPNGTTSGDTTTFAPGNYPSGISVSSTQYVNFEPGNYCFGGTVSIKGNATINANDVNMSVEGGSFAIGGSSTFNCNNALFHVDGGDGIDFNGTGGAYCNNVTFIASTGTVSSLGNFESRLFAPKGGLYEDVLIYMPFGNKSDLKLAGNQNSQFTGTIIGIETPITITGVSSSTGFHSQIIGYTVELQGSSETTLHYDPDEQYAQVDPSAITLTK